VNCSQNIPEHQ